MRAFLGNIQVTEDELDLFEKLLDVDGKNGHVFIYDEQLRQALKRQGYTQMDNIGWCWGTDRLRGALPKLRKAIEKKMEQMGS